VQLDCSFVPDHNDWVIQEVLKQVAPELAASAARSSWVTEQLANGFPDYILNLSPPSSLQHLSFQELLTRPLNEGGYQAAFVGADATGAISGTRLSAASAKAKTVYSSQLGSTEVTGTPLHIFWAMIAQMFIDRTMVALPSTTTGIAFTAVVCVLLFVITLLINGLLGMLLFLSYGAMAPLLNAVALRSAHFYMPLFDSYYVGLLVLLVAGLLRLSWVTLQHWRLEAQRRLHGHLADLKGNFVSLLSHNLNTPVAKIRGMLELLRKLSVKTDWEDGARQAESVATQLEYAIRSVLIAAALEEGVLNETTRTPQNIVDEWTASSTSSLRSLGIQLTVHQVLSDDEALLLMPLTFDMRALAAAISSMVALFHNQRRRVTVDVTMHMRQVESAENVPAELLIELRAIGGFVPPVAVAIMTDPARRKVRASSGEQFFAEVLATLIQLVAVTYDGKISVEALGDGGRILASFRPAQPRLPE
jgi:signal transduction histidine kinase